MDGYRKQVSDFIRENKRKGVLDYIVKGALLLYTFSLFITPLSMGKVPIPTPEQVVFLVLTYAVFVGKGAGFLRDLAPLVILFFAYEAMRGVFIESEQQVIVDYWLTSQTANGIEVKITPRLMNIGDSFSMDIRSQGSIEYADVVVERAGGEKLKTFMLKLEEGRGSYLFSAEESRTLFDKSGLYNVSAYANGEEGINGSSAFGITHGIHYREPIEWEKAVFGFIPSEYLQKMFYRQGQVSLIDLISVVTYCIHIPLPFFFACYIWFKDKKLYKRYSATFLILTYAGLITFMLYPAAPPWLAGLVGYLEGVRKLFHETSLAMNLVVLPSLYYWINANVVAAVPSLHAAYPLLVAIFSTKLWGRKGWLAFAYPIATAFSLVYMGEHYAVDVLLGFAYVLAALLATKLIFKWEEKRSRRKSRKKRRGA